MATLYLKAAGGNFNGANWSATGSAGVDSLTPTAADNCIMELGSGACTINSGSVCRSLDTTSGTGSYGGTITHTAGVTWTIGDGTAGAGNVAIKFNSSGMVYTLGNTISSAVALVSSSGTTQTITSGGSGKIFGNFNVNGAGASYQLADNFRCDGATFTLSQGTFDSNGKTMACQIFNYGNASNRTLTLGATVITLATNSGTVFNGTAVTNLTVTANTATINCTGTNQTFTGATKDWNGLTLNATGGGAFTLNGNNTFKSFNRTGTASKSDTMYMAGYTQTINTSLKLAGNSVTNRMLVLGIVNAPSQGFILGGTATFRTTTGTANLDLMDMTFSGGAANELDLSAISGNSGDNGANTGITFTTPATQTWSGTSGGNWSANAWTSRVPLAQDDVVVNAAFSASQTVTLDMPRAGANIDFTGVTGAPAVTFSVTSLYVRGSLTLDANLGTITNSGGITFVGRSSHTLTTAGKPIAGAGNIQLSASTSTYSQQDNLNMTGTGNYWLFTGTWNTNGYAITANSLNFWDFFSSGGGFTVFNAGSSTLTTTTTSAANAVVSSGVTFNAGTSNIVISGATSNTRTFAGGGLTYNALTYNVSGSTGQLTISGSNTFNTINFSDVTNARTLALTSGTTTTITERLNMFGTSGKLMTLNAVTAASTATVSLPTGSIQCFYLSLKDITNNSATGNQFYAIKSTKGTNVVNVTFLDDDVIMNDYQFVNAGDGISVSEKIR